MGKKLWIALLYGWTAILFFILTASALLALITKYTNITGFTLSYVTLVIGLLTLFIGGLITGLKGKSNGWVLGIMTGLGFTLFTFLVQYLGFNEMFSLKQTIFHITYVLCAVFGSIIGVNLPNSTNNQTA